MKESRKRVRQRRRTSTVTEVSAQNPEVQNTDPSTDTGGNRHSDNQTGKSIEDARLDILRILILQGKTQEEIGDFFAVSDRTIRNWKKRLANRAKQERGVPPVSGTIFHPK